jgi:hypothetical protein
LLNLLEQFFARHTHKLLVTHFAQHDTRIGALQLSEDSFEKIRHEKSVSRS